MPPRLRERREAADPARQQLEDHAADVVNDRLLEQVDFYLEQLGISEPLRAYRVKDRGPLLGYIAGPPDPRDVVVFVRGREVGQLERRDAYHLLETGHKPGDPTDLEPLERLED